DGCRVQAARLVALPVDRDQALIAWLRPQVARPVPDHWHSRRRPPRLCPEGPLPLGGGCCRAVIDGQCHLVLRERLEPAVASGPGRSTPLAERQRSVGGRDREARFGRRRIAEVDGDLSGSRHELLVRSGPEAGEDGITLGPQCPPLFKVAEVLET